MANLYRLVFAFVTLAFSAFASANIPSLSYTEGKVVTSCVSGVVLNGNWYATTAAACSAYGDAVVATYPQYVSQMTTSVSGTTCTVNYRNSANQPTSCNSSMQTRVGSPYCPANSTYNATTSNCSCNTDWIEDPTHTSCVADPNKDKCVPLSGTLDNYYTSTVATPPTSICQKLGPGSNCAVLVKFTASVTTNGVKTYYGTGAFTGKTCAQQADADAAQSPPQPAPLPSDAAGAPAPTPCKPGTFPGTVNGVSVCVPSSGQDPMDTTDTSTKTNADGSKTTTTKTTSCTANNCTTTTTATNTPAGGGTGTTTTTSDSKPKESFCQENPTASVCKSGSFAGSCSVGFICDGDALQCSIAREQYTRNCQMFDKANAESTLYDTEKVKTGDQTGSLPGNQTVTLSSSSFSQAPVFAAVGLQDLHVTVAGKDNTIDLSRLNSWLEILGYIGVAITSLVCVRIVFGGGA